MGAVGGLAALSLFALLIERLNYVTRKVQRIFYVMQEDETGSTFSGWTADISATVKTYWYGFSLAFVGDYLVTREHAALIDALAHA